MIKRELNLDYAICQLNDLSKSITVLPKMGEQVPNDLPFENFRELALLIVSNVREQLKHLGKVYSATGVFDNDLEIILSAHGNLYSTNIYFRKTDIESMTAEIIKELSVGISESFERFINK